MAILTFYPLERIRVELQSQQQNNNQPQKSNIRNATSSFCNKEKVENNPVTIADEKYNPAVNKSSKETILQCLIRLHKEKSLYRGATNMATTLMISNFIFFYALQVTRKSLTSFHNHHHHHHDASSSSAHHQRQHQRRRRFWLNKSLSSLLASTLAGMINVLLTNPLWVASLRIMESKKCLRKNNNKNNIDSNNIINHQETNNNNVWNVMHQIAQEEGP